MKLKTFYGYKIGQQQAFDKQGRRVVVTKIKTLPLELVGKKEEKKDGYNALVVKINGKRTKKPVLREIGAEELKKFKKETKISAEDVLTEKDIVQVAGISKGKGFAGVMKRWNFKGGPRTHGQSDRERAPGSIGQTTDPGRVWKGKKMPGRMGGERATIKNLNIFKVDKEKKEVWIEGLVPGGRNTLIEITKLSN